MARAAAKSEPSFVPLLGPMLTAIPMVHVLAAAAYLSTYCMSFGGDIGRFVDISDLFAVAIHDLSFTYLFTAAFLSAHVLIYDLAKRRSSAEKPTRPEATPANLFLIPEVREVFIAVTVVTLATVIHPAFGMTPDLGGPIGVWIHAALVAVILMAGLAPAMLTLGRGKFEWPPFGFAIGVLLVLASLLGAHEGAQHRTARYDEAGVARCGDHRILRGVGDYFIAVLPGHAKVLVDKDCVVRFTLLVGPPRPPWYEPKRKRSMP